MVNMLPNRAIFRNNLALYANYSGDFEVAEKEARALPPGEYPSLTFALAQVGQGQRAEAIATYEKLATVSAFGASLAAAGLADVAMVEGRFSDAARILEQGAAPDLSEKKLRGRSQKIRLVSACRIVAQPHRRRYRRCRKSAREQQGRQDPVPGRPDLYRGR